MAKPFQSLFYGLSFGESYVFATLFYLGMSFVLISSVPESKPALADTEECSYTVTVTEEDGTTHEETVDGCPDDQICCNGTCIGSGQGCCGETTYDTETHGCCEGVIYNKETQGCCQGTTVYDIESCCCGAEGASCTSNENN